MGEISLEVLKITRSQSVKLYRRMQIEVLEDNLPYCRLSNRLLIDIEGFDIPAIVLIHTYIYTYINYLPISSLRKGGQP